MPTHYNLKSHKVISLIKVVRGKKIIAAHIRKEIICSTDISAVCSAWIASAYICILVSFVPVIYDIQEYIQCTDCILFLAVMTIVSQSNTSSCNAKLSGVVTDIILWNVFLFVSFQTKGIADNVSKHENINNLFSHMVVHVPQNKRQHMLSNIYHIFILIII